MPPSKRGRWGPAAPLAVLVVGYPLWWMLGVSAFVPLLVAAGMGWHLLRHDVRVRLPPGASWWLLFLLWVLLGAALLWSDAPGAVEGGDGGGRLLVYGYRLSWYIGCTIVLLWVGNSSRTSLPDRRVHGLIGVLFVFATAGGLLGLVAPNLEFRTALEAVLPAGLRANQFVSSLVHVEVADVQYVLGHPSPRPKAPFAFTNTWGSVIALSLGFLIAFAVRSGTRTRLAVLVTVGVALVPIAHSLNRGLWVCLTVGAVGAVALIALRVRTGNVLLLIAGVGLAAVLVVVSPLGAVVADRLEHQHSNDRRGQLLTTTIDSVSTGSPVAGFGTTRDVQGSFASISGGATPDCPACGVPPLGTQGQLWLVLFSQGWLGLAFFLLFVVSALARSLRCRTVNQTLATFVLGFFLIQVFVYDTLGLPLLLIMVAIGLVWREQREEATAPGPTAARLFSHLRPWVPAACALAVVGATVGWYATPGRDQASYASEARIAVTPLPIYLSAGLDSLEEEDVDAGTRDITIDTEAALVVSERTLRRVLHHQARDDEIDTTELRHALHITAAPNTDVLVLTLTADRADTARSRVEAVARSYLATRQTYLERRRAALLAELRATLRDLPVGDPATDSVSARLNVAVNRLLLDRRSVGRVVRVTPGREQAVDLAVTTTSGVALGLLTAIGMAVASRLVTGSRGVGANPVPGRGRRAR